MTPNPYQQDIKKIKRRTRWTCAITLVLCLTVLFFSFPTTYEIMGVSYLDSDPALSWPLSVLLIVLFLFVQLVVLAVILSPLETSLTLECNPEKHLALNEALGNKRQKPTSLAIGNFYLGNYQTSAQYAHVLTKSSNNHLVASGYFNLARNAFFLKDSQTFQTAANLFRQITPAMASKPKAAAIYRKMGMALSFMEALQQGNKEVLSSYQTLAPWVANKPTEGFVHYLQALCALSLEETDQAKYHLMWVQNECPKTCLATYAKTHLENLKPKE